MKYLHITINIGMAILAIIPVSCTKPSGNIQVPSFPYESYLAQSDEDLFPKVGDDGYGFDAISHNIRYPEMPDTLGGSLFADSLLLMYNTSLAFNTMAYDVSTAERYMNDSTTCMDQVDALDSINLSGIKDLQIRDALLACSKKAAYLIKNGKRPNEQENMEIDKFYEAYNQFCNPFFNAHLTEAEFDPSPILEDYKEIHQKAITDTLSYRHELLERVCEETDFQKKCVLAREFAYANYCNPARNDKELVAVIDPILRTNDYSPLLGELWLIWRTALQKDIFGSMSNDGAMYNLFYNDMKNHVILRYIAHLKTHPSDKVAFYKFTELALVPNITRNSGAMFGNNSILDEMKIYDEIWDKDNSQNDEN